MGCGKDSARSIMALDLQAPKARENIIPMFKHPKMAFPLIRASTWKWESITSFTSPSNPSDHESETCRHLGLSAPTHSTTLMKALAGKPSRKARTKASPAMLLPKKSGDERQSATRLCLPRKSIIAASCANQYIRVKDSAVHFVLGHSQISSYIGSTDASMAAALLGRASSFPRFSSILTPTTFPETLKRLRSKVRVNVAKGGNWSGFSDL